MISKVLVIFSSVDVNRACSSGREYTIVCQRVDLSVRVNTSRRDKLIWSKYPKLKLFFLRIKSKF